MIYKSALLPGMVEWTLKQNNPDRNSCSFGCGYLFLDVCGFTKLTELVSSKGHYGVEIITNLLNQYFDLLSDKISEYGGQILKFEGDAVLAAFPLPETICMEKMQSCMQEFNLALDTLNLELQENYGSSLAYHGSIGYGESQMIIVGCPGIHLDYFVYSPVMSELYQLCEHAGHNETLAVEPDTAIENPTPTACLLTEIPAQAEISYDTEFFPPEILSRGRSETFSGELRNSAILFIGVEAGKYIREGDYKVINDYYCAIQQIVHRLEGMVNKIDYTDKGMILLLSFGILHTHVDDIERAIIAANQINRIENPLKAKIGLTYSNLYAGVLGAKLRHEYGIIGNGVNVAARLMSSAEYGQIVFTKDILNSVESRFEVKFLRKAVVKGIKGELEFFLILRELPEYVNSFIKQYHNKKQVAYLKETAEIMQSLEKKKLNQVIVCGEHGTGKSFLGWQILKSYYDLNAKIAILVMDEYNRHDRLILIRKLLAKAMGCDDPLAVPDRLKAFLKNKINENDLSLLLTTLGVEKANAAVTEETRTKHDMLVNSLAKTTELLTKDFDALLVDNVQWLDDLSLEIMQRRLKESNRKACLLILTCHPSPLIQPPTDNSRTYFLKLIDLERKNAYDLIMSRIPNITHQAGDMILELSGGNARFIIDLCTQIISLFPDPDMLITGPNIREIQNKGLLPYSLENLFMIKYEALSQEAKDILKKASIIGKGFTLNEIVETHERRVKTDISDVIAELKEKDIIDITDLAPEVQYLFSNVLMRQAVYSTILLSEKKELHNRIATYYENKYREQTDQHSELLAYHFNLAENNSKAYSYSKTAALRNQSVYNHGEAVFFYQIALQNTDDPEEKSALALSIVDSRFYLGEKDEAIEILAGIDPGNIKDRFILSKYHFLKTRSLFLGAEYETLLDYLKQVTDFAGKYGEQIRIYQLESLQKLFRMEEFAQLFQQVKTLYCQKAAAELKLKQKNTSIPALIKRLQELPEDQFSENQRLYPYLLLKLEAISLNQMIGTGRYKEALAGYLDQYDLAKILKDDLSLRIVCGQLGIVYTRMGNTEKAYKAYVEAIGIADRISDRFGFAKVLADLGALHRRLGDHEKALQNYTRSLKVFEALGNTELQGIVLHNIGEMYHWEEKYDLAMKYYRKELKITLQSGDLWGLSFAQDAVADILFLTRQFDKAKALYLKNLKMQEEIGDREGIAHTYGNLGNLANEENNYSQGIEYYAKNIQMTEEIGDLDGNGRGYSNLAGLYDKMGDLPKAVENMNIALQRFEQAGSDQFIKRTRKLLAEYQTRLARLKA